MGRMILTILGAILAKKAFSIPELAHRHPSPWPG
jgi:hypothetical protein